MKIVVRIPHLYTVSEANRRGHWAKHSGRHAVQRLAARQYLKRLTHRPRLPLIVKLTRIAPGELDGEDNLPASLKHVRDGVADWLKLQGLGVKDDRHPQVAWLYGQRKERPKFMAVDIELEWSEP